MASRFDWRGDQYQAAFRRVLAARMSTACIYLSREIKADISQPGTLRYFTKPGARSGRQKTVYNFTHSLPGNPPYKQTGHLRRSITWELAGPSGLTGRVGSNLVYAKPLETTMNRPYLRRNLDRHKLTLARIITARISPATLVTSKAFQFRPGVLGRGARGYA